MASIAKHKATEQGSAKAWAHWEGSDATIDDSFNVSSLTDSGAGEFSPNFSNNMGNANYAGSATATVAMTVASNSLARVHTFAVASVGVDVAGNGSYSDSNDTAFLVIGDLA